jgi:hypothetical protein
MFYNYITNHEMHVCVYFETHTSTLYLQFFVRRCSREVCNLNHQGKMTDQTLYLKYKTAWNGKLPCSGSIFWNNV